LSLVHRCCGEKSSRWPCHGAGKENRGSYPTEGSVPANRLTSCDSETGTATEDGNRLLGSCKLGLKSKYTNGSPEKREWGGGGALRPHRKQNSHSPKKRHQVKSGRVLRGRCFLSKEGWVSDLDKLSSNGGNRQETKDQDGTGEKGMCRCAVQVLERGGWVKNLTPKRKKAEPIIRQLEENGKVEQGENGQVVKVSQRTGGGRVNRVYHGGRGGVSLKKLKPKLGRKQPPHWTSLPRTVFPLAHCKGERNRTPPRQKKRPLRKGGALEDTSRTDRETAVIKGKLVPKKTLQTEPESVKPSTRGKITSSHSPSMEKTKKTQAAITSRSANQGTGGRPGSKEPSPGLKGEKRLGSATTQRPEGKKKCVGQKGKKTV